MWRRIEYGSTAPDRDGSNPLQNRDGCSTVASANSRANDATPARDASAVLRRRALVFVLVAAAITFLYTWRLGARSFWEPDEPRYAEIGREMLASGDWLVPRLDFIKYYEKPPLTYWVVALSFALFGVSEGTARLGPVLAALLILWASWVTAKVFYGSRAAAIAALILALSPLVWVSGRLLLTDIILSAGIAWAVAGYALALRATKTGTGTGIPMFVTGLGLTVALLAKGPIGIVIPLFGIVPLRLLAGRAAAVGVRAWAVCAGTVLALGAPWFVVISLHDRAFPWFFFVHEHFLRYLTSAANRQQDFYYYLLILLLGFFPSSILIPWSLRRTWPGMRPRTLEGQGTMLLASMGLLTLLFFSASQSKLASYILPVVPAFALIVARALDVVCFGGADEAPAPRGLRLNLAIAAVLATAGPVAAMLLVRSFKVELPAGFERGVYFLAFVQAVLAGTLWAATASGKLIVLRRSMIATGLTLFVLLNLVTFLAETADSSQSVKEAARFVASRAGPDDVVASYGGILQGLTFYANRRTTIVASRGELDFGAGLEPEVDWLVRKKDLPHLLEMCHTYVVVRRSQAGLAIEAADGRLRPIHEGPTFIVLTNGTDPGKLSAARRTLSAGPL